MRPDNSTVPTVPTASPSTPSSPAARCAAADRGRKPRGARCRGRSSSSSARIAAPRPRARSRGALDPEDLLHLAPDRQRHDDGQEGEQHEDDPEARVGPSRRAPARDPGAAAGAFAGVRTLDRSRVERRRVVVERRRASRGLGHARILVILGGPMAVEAERLPVESLARVAQLLASGLELRPALDHIADAVAEATGADVAVVRVLDHTGMLVARAVAPADSAFAAELAGSRVPPEELADGQVPPSTLKVAERSGASGILVVPARVRDRVVAAVELLRADEPFDSAERALAELAAAQLALVVGRLGVSAASAAGADTRRAAQQAVRLASDATGATGAALWRTSAERGAEVVALFGDAVEGVLDRAGELAREALSGWRPLAVEHDEALPDDARYAASVQLGQPPFGVLQLFFAEAPSEQELAALAAFGVRAAHALRVGDHVREAELELDRTRALLSVVGEAISRLSLAHTLETAVERIAELLAIERVGVYLRDGNRLVAAAGRGLSEGHEAVAERLLELALGPLRARGTIAVALGDHDAALASVRSALRDAGVDAALAVPLHVHGDPIGLLVVYPGSRIVAETDNLLLASLAAQLAVAVQNARLHEQAKELGEQREAALRAEQEASRQVGALYEISRSFAQSLSLDTTLEAVTSTIVDVLGVDAAVIRVPDERGDLLVPRKVHVSDARLEDPIRTILARPQARPPRGAPPTLLDVPTAAALGG